MQLISTIASGDETVRMKSPSSPVEVPFEVPCSMTVAPITGPMASSTTPLTWYPPWADANVENVPMSTIATRVRILFIRK